MNLAMEGPSKKPKTQRLQPKRCKISSKTLLCVVFLTTQLVILARATLVVESENPTVTEAEIQTEEVFPKVQNSLPMEDLEQTSQSVTNGDSSNETLVVSAVEETGDYDSEKSARESEVDSNEQRLELKQNDGSFAKKKAKANKEDLENQTDTKKNMNGSIYNPFTQDIKVPENSTFLQTKKQSKNEDLVVPKKVEMGDPSKVQKVVDESIKHDTSSSEKKSKSHPKEIEKKRDMEASESLPMKKVFEINDRTPSGSSKIKVREVENVKKAMMQDYNTDNPTEPSTDDKEDDLADTTEESDPLKVNTAPRIDRAKPVHDKNNDEYPVYDESEGGDQDDIVIDLDSDDEPEAVDTSNTKLQSQDQGKDVEGSDDIQVDVVNKKAQVRARVRKDRLTRTMNDAHNNDIFEVPSAASTDGYRGEPWGQYRSTRRIPDMELLRRVFQNELNDRGHRNGGDPKSQEVVKNWQNDPMYDESTSKDVGDGEPPIIDESDTKFLEYRSRLLSRKDNESVGANSDSIHETKREDGKVDDISGKNNRDRDNNSNVDSNAEFVKGLENIHGFFDRVDLPPELTVGDGSSIQDVLTDKAKHLLLKKAREVAQWLETGWEKIGAKLKARISRSKKMDKEKTQEASELDSDALESSSRKGLHKRSEEIDIKENIISAWRTGKRAYESISVWLDKILDRFDNGSADDLAKFDDFKGFDLDSLSTMTTPS